MNSSIPEEPRLPSWLQDQTSPPDSTSPTALTRHRQMDLRSPQQRYHDIASSRRMLMVTAGVDLLTALLLLTALHPDLRALDPWFSHSSVTLLATCFLLASMGEFLGGTDPVRHWQGAFLSMVGRVLYPLMLFVESRMTGMLWTPAMTVLSSSALFALPLYLVLRRAWLDHVSAGEPLHSISHAHLSGYMEMACNQDGDSLAETSRHQTLMVVFLRHFGCTFCREAMTDLARRRREIEAAGVRIVVVHMSDDDRAFEILTQYELQSVDRVADADCELYRAFGLGRGAWRQLFGLEVILRGIGAALFQGHWIGPLEGDGFRMPGVFLIRDSRITGAFRHETSASRPDYLRMVNQSLACDSNGQCTQ